MEVKLIAYTVSPEHPEASPVSVVEYAASRCYDSKPTKSFAIAKGCAKSGHLSVWEHISFSFAVSDVSRALLAQLTRHRHLSFSVRSQRYCDESRFRYVEPSFDSRGAETNFQRAMETAGLHYQALLEQGVPQEDARAVLPNACATELVVTGNARALIEASHLRLCSRAQKEIRTLFGCMKEEVARVCPEVASLMVPNCEAHAVPFCEERQSCGRHKTLEELAGEAPKCHS